MTRKSVVLLVLAGLALLAGQVLAQTRAQARKSSGKTAVPASAPAVVIPPRPAPTPAPPPPPAQPPSDPLILAVAQAKCNDEVNAAYPGLRAAGIAWAQDRRAYLATSQPAYPVISKMAFVNIVSCKDFPEVSKYLNYWARTRFALRLTNLHYAHNAFDKVLAVPPPRHAHVICEDQGRYSVLRFVFKPALHPASQPATQPGKIPPGRWEDADICPLVGAARLGAAIGLIQEMFESARDGKPLETFFAASSVWPGPKPAVWVVFEQKLGKGSLGFLSMEDKLQDDRQNSVRIGVKYRDEAKKEFGLNITLARKADREGYLGWRVEKLEPADDPQTEPAR